VELWQQHQPCAARLIRKDQLYTTTAEPSCTLAPGRLRLATTHDGSCISGWARAFGDETLHIQLSGQAISAWMKPLLDDGRLFVWEDGEPVSMLAQTGHTPNGARIGVVYTPPPQRRRGYARSAVVALTQRLMRQGRRFCCLYADEANQASNHMYRALGFEPGELEAEYAFSYQR
jgi:hypothetical protein